MTETVVLLSGGIDSASCLAFYGQLDHAVSGVFIDYGQPVRGQEEKSAAAIAAYYKIPLTIIRCSGPQTNYAGEIAGRNSLLVFAALVSPDSAGDNCLRHPPRDHVLRLFAIIRGGHGPDRQWLATAMCRSLRRPMRTSMDT